jgi:hypothetical protein
MVEQFTQTIFDVNTGESQIVNLTDEQIKYVLKTRKIAEKVRAEEQAEAEAKATARQAILDRLGLTAHEAAILLG